MLLFLRGLEKKNNFSVFRAPNPNSQEKIYHVKFMRKASLKRHKNTFLVILKHFFKFIANKSDVREI